MRKYLQLLIVFILFSCSPVRKYQRLPEVLSWEKSILEFEQLDKSEHHPDSAILFTGSSSIRLWSTLEKDMFPFPVIHRGYGGAKLSDFTIYADRIIEPHPCRAIVIFIANDITGSDKDKSPQEVAELYRCLIKTIRKTHHDTPVFWIEITPTSSRWKVWPEITKANNLIKDICNKQKNCYFITTGFAFLNDEGKPKDELFRPDKLHLNEEGYKVWSEIIKREISKVLVKNSHSTEIQ
ncbi:MAG TPA: GDSL-type esterase/lipase family protein [Bacteroidales bacterium]|nr:GDSL-type esterase/lipase family protein [Bacteroidales bacterium]HPT21467.1 GDSL-type esterase/lipase family protein [Bacteroidales bacterium]